MGELDGIGDDCTPDNVPRLRCRLDYGIAVGTLDVDGPAVLPGLTGVVAQNSASLVRAVAAYRFKPGSECPVPELR